MNETAQDRTRLGQRQPDRQQPDQRLPGRKPLATAIGLALTALGLLAAPTQAEANEGQLLLVTGNVTIQRSIADPQGTSGQAPAPHAGPAVLIPSAGHTVHTGDTIITGYDGRAQIRFSDGSLVSLQPRTEFRIDRYRYDTADQRGFFSLAAGAIRTVSGLVGKRNPADYRLSTPSATIGIRGTQFIVEQTVCNPDCHPGNSAGLRVAVTEGHIVVGNRAGYIEVPAGRAAFAADPATAPVPTEDRPQMSTALPTSSTTRVAASSTAGTNRSGTGQITGEGQVTSAGTATRTDPASAPATGRRTRGDAGASEDVRLADADSGNRIRSVADIESTRNGGGAGAAIVIAGVDPGLTQPSNLATGTVQGVGEARTPTGERVVINEIRPPQPAPNPGVNNQHPGQGAGVGTNPGTNPGTDPGTNPGTDPGTNPGTDPGTNPGTNPGTDPGTNPGTDPGTNPGTDPGTNPGTDPGTNPGTNLGTNPGTNPGTDPGTNPGTNPGPPHPTLGVGTNTIATSTLLAPSHWALNLLDPVTDTTRFDSRMELESIGKCPSERCLSRGTAQVVEAGGNDYLRWGRWISGTSYLTVQGIRLPLAQTANRGQHYLVGVPTVTMPTQGDARYDLAGATAPTFSMGNRAPGTFSGEARVQFGTGAATRIGLDANLNFSDGTHYRMQSQGGVTDVSQSELRMTDRTTFGGNIGVQTLGTDSINCRAGNCRANISGGFYGPDAQSMGLQYSVGQAIGTSRPGGIVPQVGTTIDGVSVFTRSSDGP